EALAAEIRYYYNTAHLLERREQENGNQDVVTKYGYDSYGNVTSHTDGNGYTTTFVYDDQYQTFLRFKTRKFTEEIRYDDLMRPERKVDANGQIWQTVYDTFSRVKAEIKPGDSTTAPITRISYPDEFVNTSGVIQFPDVMKTERKITDSDYLESYVYQDGFERVIQEKTEAKQGWITIDHLFDNGGRQYSTSVPIYTSTASYTAPASGTKTTTYQFDPIGRITRTTNPDGAYRRTFYGKFDTLTVDELGHVVNHRVVGNIEDDITYTGIYPSQVEYAKTSTISACDGVKRIDAGKNEFVTLHDMLGRTVSSTTPLNGTWSFSYDANGNRITQTDAKKQTISFAYDELDRMYQKTYPNGQTVTYSYDEDGYGYSKGWLTRVVYPKGSESYTYDARGRHSIVTQTIGGLTRTQQFTYNALDQVATQKYPDGEVVNCNYDNGGYLANLKGISTYVDNLEYHPTGKVSKLLYGNGVRTDYDYYDTTSEYDNTSGLSYSFRLRQIRALNTKTGSDLFNLTYEYDKVGNVKVKRDNLNGALTEQYGYDDLDRLTNATSTSYGNKAFRYDMLNNIMEKDTRTYQYEATRPYMVANDGKYGYTYDANGNQNGRSDGRVLTWDYDNRLTAVSDGGINYYRADGQRMAKEEDGVTTYYFFNDYEEEYRAGTKTKTVKYYFANNQRVAENSSVEGIRYYHQDHLGSSSALSDANATLLLRTNYAPYGETITTQGNASVKYRFTGKEQDGTGLYYFGARYYDPMMGRFISVDPIGDGINWYGYCNGNPIKYVDLDGQKTTIYIHSGENIFGHTAINVNGNVYSFGRYNGMYSSSEGSRLPGRLAQFNPSGEGILFSVSEKTYFE
ncbi:MAG TPA: RHS repeat-associated core domain-containing protein, partial [Bacillota bacterium]|nr:RHS repeat-associated core domain-containing protein [Bacillota bacterium]